MTIKEFMRQLDQMVQSALERIETKSSAGSPAQEITISKLLGLALKNELEASEEAALWLIDEKDIQVKLGLARQCGDEAKHYKLIEKRLRELNVDTAQLNPLAEGYGPMFSYLKSLTTTAERLAAGQFTREALAQVRNQVFIQYCEEQGDHETAKLYREVIQPDEKFHHELGRQLLPRFVETEEQQKLAWAAAEKTLQLAEELQEIARLKKGICRAPGC